MADNNVQLAVVMSINDTITNDNFKHQDTNV